MEQFNSVVNENLGWVHENKYVLPVLSLFLGMYAALARPKLPNFIAKLFENPVFRLVMISYIIYRGNKDPQLSLMIAAAFLITMHMINKQQVEAISLHDTDSTANSVAGGLGRLAQSDDTGNAVAGGLGRLAQSDDTGNAVAGGLGRLAQSDDTGNAVAGGLGRLAQICYDENGNQVACGPGRLAQNDNTGNAVAGGLGRLAQNDNTGNAVAGGLGRF